MLSWKLGTLVNVLFACFCFLGYWKVFVKADSKRGMQFFWEAWQREPVLGHPQPLLRDGRSNFQMSEIVLDGSVLGTRQPSRVKVLR